MMLANNTCVAQLFHRALRQYDRLRKRNAFVDQYARVGSFELEEFDSARDVVAALAEEYKAAETPEYADYVPPN